MASSLAASAKTSISTFKLSSLISKVQCECEAPPGRISGAQIAPWRKTWNLQYTVNSNVFFGPSLQHLCESPVVLVGVFLFPSDLFADVQCVKTDQGRPAWGLVSDRPRTGFHLQVSNLVRLSSCQDAQKGLWESWRHLASKW